MTIKEIYTQQNAFFNTNATKGVDFRIEQLRKLKRLLKENEASLYKAIYNDFEKSEFETYATELGWIYHEISRFEKNIKRWGKRKNVSTGLANFPARSYIIREPLGTVLVIGAWNYPYQLSLMPAITALAAGNTAILKPSELPSNTSKIMAKIINENFPSNYFAVIEGGVKETTELLELRFDKIFFTGSIPVGRIIYQAAAKHLTPVTLELGGKSPTFVMADTDIKQTAKRIVWAKFLNAGQTCIAPDYILAEKSVEANLLEGLKQEINTYYKQSYSPQDNYMKIINNNNFARLVDLFDSEKVYCGGHNNPEERFISPTVLHNITFDDKVMQDEIFGPILPVLTFTNLDNAIQEVKARPKPLSCYIYSKSRKNINKVLQEVSFGGGAINDSVMHITNGNLPFGGVGFSGMGAYHGKTGFDEFSHKKSILDKPFRFETRLRYAPYTAKKLRMVKRLIK